MNGAGPGRVRNMMRMVHGDAAFMWETEAMRASRRAQAPDDPPTTSARPSESWVTLREAHYQTGIPVETLRKWARKAAVPSYLDESPLGVRRMITLDAVRRRAADLERPIAPIERPAPPPEPAPAEPPAPAPNRPDSDTGQAGPPSEPQSGDEEAADASTAGRSAPVAAAPNVGDAVPPDTMIVPVAAWDKMLLQLGNLHEAGQQLAESRERAAKAETEAKFLRERLGELRADLVRARRAEAEHPAPPDPTPLDAEQDVADAVEADDKLGPAAAGDDNDPGVAPQAQTEKLWRYIYRGWRARRP